MNYDWSMDTKSCDKCGRCVEGWIVICDDCEESEEEALGKS